MTNTEVKMKREELDLYKREVEAREKQAEALDTIANRLFVHASDPLGSNNLAEAVANIAIAISKKGD